MHAQWRRGGLEEDVPRMLWTVPDRAPGREEWIGFGKWRVASTTASADDWIPVSTDVVRATRSEYPNSLGMPHPNTKPRECRIVTAMATAGPATSIADDVCAKEKGFQSV